MHYPELKRQIDHIIRTHASDAQFARLMYPAWKILDAFIASQNVPTLKRIDDIPKSLFAPFVAHCEASQMPDAQLFMVLAAVRTLMVFAGRDHRDLADLVAPRKRKRVKNTDSGAYQFKYFAKDADASPEHAAGDAASAGNGADAERH